VLRVAGETKTTRESIQDCSELDEESPGFELLIEQEIALAIIIYLISSKLHIFVLLEFTFVF
jgi:hypothetical protein